MLGPKLFFGILVLSSALFEPSHQTPVPSKRLLRRQASGGGFTTGRDGIVEVITTGPGGTVGAISRNGNPFGTGGNGVIVRQPAPVLVPVPVQPGQPIDPNQPQQPIVGQPGQVLVPVQPPVQVTPVRVVSPFRSLFGALLPFGASQADGSGTRSQSQSEVEAATTEDSDN
ncbi:hypothetical protein BKA69DRAFT_1123826 [Paraphysoderma sedebokerense]|nr:hypothetical protein BKA69DRAFT_1123826 [Paraphysoderma sedebokerense]